MSLGAAGLNTPYSAGNGQLLHSNWGENAITAAAATATQTSAVLRNDTGKGLIISLNIPATFSAGQINQIDVLVPKNGGASDFVLHSFAAINKTLIGDYLFAIYPAALAASGWTATPINGIIPPQFKIKVTHNTADPLTYTVNVAHMK